MKSREPEKHKRRSMITQGSTAAHNDAVIRVYDDAGNVVETHEHKGDFKEPSA